MISYVLDASAILRFTDKEAGYDRIHELFNQSAKGKIEVLISAVNWSEVLAALYKRAGGNHAAAKALAGNLAALPLTIAAADQATAEEAASLKSNFKLPLADAFAAALTRVSSANSGKQTTLVTADYDFKAIPAGTMRIEFLPVK